MTIDKKISHAFWKQMAQKKDNRWTTSEMLNWEIVTINNLVPHANQVLDLGSGHGKLSRKILDDKSELLAVDWIDEYKNAFNAKNHKFICAPLITFDTKKQFDLVLLFGVVTCLHEEEELKIYKNIARFLKPSGIAIIKNQCSNDQEFSVNGYSEDLKSQYSGRYPAIKDQQNRLNKIFSKVETIRYPAQYNKWANSSHILFHVKL